jgi:hypothetical protein
MRRGEYVYTLWGLWMEARLGIPINGRDMMSRLISSYALLYVRKALDSCQIDHQSDGAHIERCFSSVIRGEDGEHFIIRYK